MSFSQDWTPAERLRFIEAMGALQGKPIAIEQSSAILGASLAHMEAMRPKAEAIMAQAIEAGLVPKAEEAMPEELAKLARARQFYRLVLVDGTVLTAGDPWPGPDNKPFMIERKTEPAQPLNGEIFLIAYSPGLEETYTAAGRTYSRILRPAQYKVMMRSALDPITDPHGIKNPAGFEETHVNDIAVDKVKYACRKQPFRETLAEFGALIDEMQDEMADLFEDEEDEAEPEGDDEDDDDEADEKENGVSAVP